jgi:tetratricopeptide (TPR) repeat protein
MLGLSDFLTWLTRPQGQGERDPDPVIEALLRQLRAIEWLTFRLFLVLLLFIGLYAYAHTAPHVEDKFLYICGVLLGLTIASTSCGGFLGFLFGIPRLLQHGAAASARTGSEKQPTEDSASRSERSDRRFFATNTNLEEISDWVTKIIVGLSLVQATMIYDKLKRAAVLFHTQVLPSTGGEIVFLLVVASAGIIGFVFFYMETRTRIALLFAITERATDSREIVFEPQVLKTVLTAPIAPAGTGTGSDSPVVPADKKILEASDRKVLETSYQNLKTVDELAAWASAQARANNFQAAIRALQDAIAKDPEDVGLLLRLADIQERIGNRQAAYTLISEARQKRPDDPDLLNRELLAALYLRPPDSFQKAFEIEKEILKHPKMAKDPFVHLWIAAAHGQRYQWLEENNGSNAEKEAERKAALAAVRKVVELASDPESEPRRFLRRLFDPERENSSPGENDLEVFKSDPQFKQLVYQAAPEQAPTKGAAPVKPSRRRTRSIPRLARSKGNA